MRHIYDLVYNEEKKTKQKLISVINNNIKDLMTELKIDNPHVLFYVASYLLWNGYFSYEKNYSFSTKNVVDEEAQIFIGYGVCRHHVNLFGNIYRGLSYKVNELPISHKKSELEYNMGIDKDISVNYLPKITKKTNNHQALLIKYSDSSFILDPTNLVEIEILKNYHLHCYNGTYLINKKLLKKSLTDFFNKELYNAKIASKTPTYSKDEIEDLYYEGKVICHHNSSLLDDFYIDNSENYSRIKNLALRKWQ